MIISFITYLWLRKLKKIDSFINFLLILALILWFYSMVIYYLEIKHILSIGWVFYSLIFFLIPTSLILVLMLILRKLKNGRTQ